MIAIIDYGLGNVKAFAEVYKKLNIPAVIVKKAEDLKNADKIILPGVGAFDHAMNRLEQTGMRQFLDEIVIHRHVPLLGICVGMQILANCSEEGNLPGLGWIKGKVKKFTAYSPGNYRKLPHMGWNTIKPLKQNILLQGLDSDSRFYFLHSYFFQTYRNEDNIAVTDYEEAFTCVVNYRNIYGVQFHPEKSHQWGIRLLENYAKI